MSGAHKVLEPYETRDIPNTVSGIDFARHMSFISKKLGLQNSSSYGVYSILLRQRSKPIWHMFFDKVICI